MTVPIDEVTCDVIGEYIGFLHHRRLRPQTINCYLDGIRKFYDYLKFEERRDIVNPVKNEYKQILPKPLPRFLKDQELRILLRHVTHQRDRAMLLSDAAVRSEGRRSGQSHLSGNRLRKKKYPCLEWQVSKRSDCLYERRYHRCLARIYEDETTIKGTQRCSWFRKASIEANRYRFAASKNEWSNMRRAREYPFHAIVSVTLWQHSC